MIEADIEHEAIVIDRPSNTANPSSTPMQVPYFRTDLSPADIAAVVACLESGWLTTGAKTREFEARFAETVKGKHAIAVNSCTAALHLAVEALGLRAGQAVLVPTLTFAATAEILLYQGALPILVDSDPVTLHMDLHDAERKLTDLRAGRLPVAAETPVVGIIPMHLGGLMMDMDAVQDFADRHQLWVVEDAAHSFPAGYYSERRQAPTECGERTSAATCYSFYTNKTMTTGEGGMIVTDDDRLAARMRQMSLHGLTNDAWTRFSSVGSWDYRIQEAGYKYNLTDIASSLGLEQLRRAEAMRQARQAIAEQYLEALRDQPAIELPPTSARGKHAWHLFSIRLRLDRLTIDRNQFIEQLRTEGIGCSVHWRPLHLHPYYEQKHQWRADLFPVSTAGWTRLISLPLFPSMRPDEQEHVIRAVIGISQRHAR